MCDIGGAAWGSTLKINRIMGRKVWSVDKSWSKADSGAAQREIGRSIATGRRMNNKKMKRKCIWLTTLGSAECDNICLWIRPNDLAPNKVWKNERTNYIRYLSASRAPPQAIVPVINEFRKAIGGLVAAPTSFISTHVCARCYPPYNALFADTQLDRIFAFWYFAVVCWINNNDY